LDDNKNVNSQINLIVVGAFHPKIILKSPYPPGTRTKKTNVNNFYP